jgi:hypothetical protein
MNSYVLFAGKLKNYDNIMLPESHEIKFWTLLLIVPKMYEVYRMYGNFFIYIFIFLTFLFRTTMIQLSKISI